MLSPQFSSEQFVDNTTLSAAFSQVLSSAREYGANAVFLNPGLVSANSLIFGYNNNLIVTVTANSPFKCLFLTGAYSYANGIIDGQINSQYQVNFASLIPTLGPVTAYIVATYQQIQSGAMVILGPPPGHPDYSASFNAYVAYSGFLDSINIFATITPPDNTATLEIARTTLIVGQSIIAANSLDTTHQVAASVVVQPPQINLGGDVTGQGANNTLAKIQGITITAPAPAPGQVLTYNGQKWLPISPASTLPPSGPAGGDLSGNYPSPVVAGLRGTLIGTPFTPSTGQFLGYTGAAWLPVTPPVPIQQQGTTPPSGTNLVLNAGTPFQVQSISLAVPAGNWRLIVFAFVHIQLPNNSDPVRYQFNSYIQDSLSNQFCTSLSSPYNPGGSGIAVTGLNSADISPLYTGPIPNLTIELWVGKAGGNNPPNPQVIGDVNTRISYVLVPSN